MKQFHKGFGRILSALLIAVLMFTASVPAFAVSKGDILTVTGDYARVRSKPVAGSDVLTKLARGTKVKFLKDYSGWWKIQLSNGKSGFMYKTFLSPYIPAKVGNLYKSRINKLAIRSKPNAKSKVKFNAKKSTTLVLLERHGSWGLVRSVASGKVGYVNLKYLRNAKSSKTKAAEATVSTVATVSN